MKTRQPMRSIIIATVVVLLGAASSSVPAVAGDLTPTVQAATFLTGSFPNPNPHNNTSGPQPGSATAKAEDIYSYIPPDLSYVVTASLEAQAVIGVIKLYSRLTASKALGTGLRATATGSFSDKASISFFGDPKTNPTMQGVMKLKPQITSAQVTGTQMWGAEADLDVTIHNTGSVLHSKDETSHLSVVRTWGMNGPGTQIVGPTEFPIQAGDNLEITATEVLKTDVVTVSQGGYSDVVADLRHTTRLCIDPLTDGFLLVSDSGHDYTTPKNSVERPNWMLYE